MLQTQAVYPDTLALLKKLVELEELQPFVLAGGTALALQLGHRFSVDLDFFNLDDFDEEVVHKAICSLGKNELLNKRKNSLNVILEDVKIDALRYPYPRPDAVIEIEGIRMFSPKDIAAMKLDAMSARGAKKDFYDIYFLLKMYSLREMLDFHSQKYQHTTQFHIIRSLTYFEDAELQTDPISLEPISWAEVKTKLIEAVRGF